MTRSPHGADDRRAKLTWEQVERLRARYAAGETDMTALAREHGVSRACIWRVLNGFSYTRER